jgi:aminoethylphosphonate catabolism LysR family transcriptional regulator
MNYAQLRAFHAVASEGSFTRAARVLRVSQPTVSSQVKALETAYDVRLFDRQGRKVRPTEQGAALFDITRRLFGLEVEAEEALVGALSLERGQLKVGADSPPHAMPLLARFHARHPGIRLALVSGNARDVAGALADYRVDVAVMAGDPPPPPLLAFPFREDPLVLIGGPRHALARRGRARFAELAGQAFVLREPTSLTRQMFESALRRAGVAVRTVLEVDGREALREAVAAGMGLGVTTQGELGRDPRLKPIEIADATLALTQRVVCLAERRRLGIVKAFLDVAREAATPAR